MYNEKNHTVNIYFDESGKANEALHLMGAILFPQDYYLHHQEKLDDIIQNAGIHWTSYGGHTAIRDSIKTLL